eukprot:TRINITY_DN31135_c0_g1_i1.p1 TRINITY_DN31135_c0_g1~~TRINITY_DN31135_c0_g1_i1.p1  ORF type:complete len:184 (+),score=45.36 TRINITY_DN31135_c0_g1_i1:54-605(+)
MSLISATLKDNEILDMIFNSEGLPTAGATPGPEVPSEYPEEVVRRVRQLELDAVRKAEQHDLDGALSLFDQAVATAPRDPSVYNNRAQARQLKGDLDGAMADLDRAVEFSSGKSSVAKQAYSQRGVLRLRNGDEEGARTDFEKAAALGSGFAAQQAARLNPFAKLCNQMVTQMMQNELKPCES